MDLLQAILIGLGAYFVVDRAGDWIAWRRGLTGGSTCPHCGWRGQKKDVREDGCAMCVPLPSPEKPRHERIEELAAALLEVSNLNDGEHAEAFNVDRIRSTARLVLSTAEGEYARRRASP